MSDQIDSSEETKPLHEEIAGEIERLQSEVTASFERGYAEGRRAQLAEDQFYIDRAERLARLLAEAEQEIQRVREKLMQK